MTDLPNAPLDELRRLKAASAARDVELDQIKRDLAICIANQDQLLMRISELVGDKSLLQMALRWMLDEGVVMCVRHSAGVPQRLLVSNSDYEPVYPPESLAPVLAEVLALLEAERRPEPPTKGHIRP